MSEDAIGFASDGLVQAAGSGVTPIDCQGYGQSVVVNIVGESTALKAIAKGLSDCDFNSASYATDQASIGWRPFLNVETAPPTGEVLWYPQFVFDPANNENIVADRGDSAATPRGS
jgi:hypothetical protein